MRIGTYIPDFRDVDLRKQSAGKIIADIADIGFDSIWHSDNLGRAEALHEPMNAIAMAAAVTNIEVGTAILQLPLRHPVETANKAMSLYVLSGGRFTLGVGTGSTRRDYELVDREFDNRYTDLREYIDIMRRLWAGETVDGKNLPMWPGYDHGPDIIIGSVGSPKWVIPSAEKYDGWMTSIRNAGWEMAEDRLKLFRDHGGKRAIASSIMFDATSETNSGGYKNVDFTKPLSPIDAKEVATALAGIGFDDMLVRGIHGDHDELAAIRAIR